MYLSLLLMLLTCIGCSHRSTGAVTEKNPHGIVFLHEKIAEETGVEGPKEFYRLKTDQVPPSKQFILIGKTFSEAEKPIYHLQSDENGKLAVLAEKGAIPLEEVLFRLAEFRKGEPYEYTLVSKDGDTRLSTQIIPFPIERIGVDQAKISVVIGSPEAQKFTCVGAGFQREELLTMYLRTGEGESVYRFQADAHGHFQQEVVLEVLGRKGGMATLTLMRSHEVLNLDFGWGREAMIIYKGEPAVIKR